MKTVCLREWWRKSSDHAGREKPTSSRESDPVGLSDQVISIRSYPPSQAGVIHVSNSCHPAREKVKKWPKIFTSTASCTESCADSHHLLPLSLIDSHLQLPSLLIYIPYLVLYSDEDSKGSEFSSYSSYAMTTTSAHLPKLIKGIPRSIQLTHFGCMYSLSTLL